MPLLYYITITISFHLFVVCLIEIFHKGWRIRCGFFLSPLALLSYSSCNLILAIYYSASISYSQSSIFITIYFICLIVII